jgi:hypothetical protein
MKPERPVVVLVFAILNLVFGGLGILGFLCGGIILAIVFAALSSAPAGTAFPHFPSGLVTLFVVLFIYGFIMAVVLVLSGIGLLNMKRWGRNTAIAYSIITIVYSIVATVINITYIGPTMQKWQSDLQEEIARDQQLKGQPPPPNMYQPSQSPLLNAATSIVGAIFGMAYAIALLVVMYLPHVSAAFAGREIRRGIDWDRDPEYETQD